MSEIPPTGESSVFFETEPVDLFPFWKKRAIDLSGFAAIASGAFSPNQKRKRRITIGPILEGQAITGEPVEINVQEITPQQDSPVFTPPLNPPSPVSSGQQTAATNPLHICTEEEKENIQTIFTALGTKNYFELGRMAIDLTNRGKAIEHLHPFQLLGVIFSNQELKEYIKVVMNSTLNWPLENTSKKMKFLNGISENFERESKKNNIDSHIEEFARKIFVSATEIRPLIQAREWEKLIFHLIEKSGAPGAQTFLE